MAIDFNIPITSTAYAAVLANLRDNIAGLGMGMDSALVTSSNVPVGGFRTTRVSAGDPTLGHYYQRWNGTSWYESPIAGHLWQSSTLPRFQKDSAGVYNLRVKNGSTNPAASAGLILEVGPGGNDHQGTIQVYDQSVLGGSQGRMTDSLSSLMRRSWSFGGAERWVMTQTTFGYGATAFEPTSTIHIKPDTSNAIRVARDGGLLALFNTADTVRQGYMYASSSELALGSDVGSRVRLTVGGATALELNSTGSLARAWGVDLLTATSPVAIQASVTQDGSTVDWNTLTANSWYTISGANAGGPNGPGAAVLGTGVLTTFRSNANFVSQVYYPTNGSPIYLRTRTASSWSSWRKVLTASELDPTDVALLSGATFVGSVRINSRGYTQEASVTFATGLSINAALSNAFKVVLTGNVTSLSLVNPVAGQFISLRVTQDATGGRTFTVGGGSAIAGAVNTAANKVSYLTITWNSDLSRIEGSWVQMP